MTEGRQKQPGAGQAVTPVSGAHAQEWPLGYSQQEEYVLLYIYCSCVTVRKKSSEPGNICKTISDAADAT